jgi:hypothetical protein
VNGNLEFDWNNIWERITTQKDLFGYSVSNIRSLLMRNIPLTVGVIIGVFYGFKKA